MRDALLQQIKRTEELQRSLFAHNDKNPFHNTSELCQLLKDAIDAKTPFSLIRIGDGEGRILAYPQLFDDKIYINDVLTYQYGSEVIAELIKEFGSDYLDTSMKVLQNMVLEAISNADVIGACSWLHFRDEVCNTNIIPQAANSVCLEKVKKFSRPEVPVFDAFIFKPFHKDGCFDKLFNSLDRITVISHTDISEKLIKTFKFSGCNHIKIPGHQSFMQSEEFHFPSKYKEIEIEIKISEAGQVFLVAAGYLGKHYCNIIKQRGGIAIDIGSIFDGWCGMGRADATANMEHRL